MTSGLKMAFLLFFCLVFSAPSAHGQQEMLIGLVPEENIFRQMDRYRPLAVYLSEKLGMKVKLTILSKYGDIIDKFASRNMDGAFLETFTSVLAMEKLGVEPVARQVNTDGTSTVQGYIFVRTDSGIRTVREMKGKRMAFVDRATVTGFLYAVAFFREQGVKDFNHYFREYYFTGSHDSAVYAVLDNRADVGAADSKVFKRLVGKDPAMRNELTVIAKSGELPDATLCLKRDMPDAQKARIRTVLLQMNRDPAGQEVLRKMGAARFSEAAKKDFLPFSAVAQAAGIDLKTYRYK